MPSPAGPAIRPPPASELLAAYGTQPETPDYGSLAALCSRRDSPLSGTTGFRAESGGGAPLFAIGTSLKAKIATDQFKKVSDSALRENALRDFAILKQIGSLQGHVLELGSGKGYLVQLLNYQKSMNSRFDQPVADTARIFAVEPDPQAMKQAINSGRVVTEQAFVGTLQEYAQAHHGSRTFDNIVAARTHLPFSQLGDIFKAAAAMLAPSGVLTLLFFDAAYRSPAYQKTLADAARDHFPAPPRCQTVPFYLACSWTR